MHKKTELMFSDCHSSICVESNSEDDLIILSITEYKIDEEKTTKDEEHLKTASTTEIYISEKEAGAIVEALLETLGEE